MDLFYEYIFGLDIPVDDVVLPQVQQHHRQLHHDLPDIILTGHTLNLAEITMRD